ncbi:MAG TPA: phosphatidylserine decarboxylase family protein, partial [Phycisphaerae bacterium]|nr:phosphatidylserine decarboxylase family protein [Phycisphaerae bacterium]
MLTKYGAPIWITCSIVLAALCALAAWLFWPAVAIPVILWIWVLWFFRDPRRPSPQGPGLFISPADGTVTDITPVGTDSLLGCDGTRVGVFMSVFSVHVNRSACEGTVDRVQHNKGVFLDARDAMARERNESADIFLTHTSEGNQYPIVMRQVAGFVARRIIT